MINLHEDSWRSLPVTEQWWFKNLQGMASGEVKQTVESAAELNRSLQEAVDFIRKSTAPASVNSREGVVSAWTAEWLDPRRVAPPSGVSLQILGASGRQIPGPWTNTPFNIAWAPLLKIPDWARSRLQQAYWETPSIAGCDPVVHTTYISK